MEGMDKDQYRWCVKTGSKVRCEKRFLEEAQHSLFTEEDTCGWVNRVECYFKLKGMRTDGQELLFPMVGTLFTNTASPSLPPLYWREHLWMGEQSGVLFQAQGGVWWGKITDGDALTN